MVVFDMTSENSNPVDEPIVSEKGSGGLADGWCGPLGNGPGIPVP